MKEKDTAQNFPQAEHNQTSTLSSNLALSLTLSLELDKQYSSLPIIYADASYFEQELPKEIEFVYIIIQNHTKTKRTLTAVELFFTSFDTKQSENACKEMDVPFSLDLHFSKNALFGKKVDANKAIILACLREHITKNIIYKYPLEHVYLQAKCTMLDEKVFCSNALELDLNYPINPLQDIELIDFYSVLKEEQARYNKELSSIITQHDSLYNYANLHHELGIQLIQNNDKKYYLCKEYAPHAKALFLSLNTDGFGNFKEYPYTKEDNGYWSLYLPHNCLYHGMYYELHVYSHKDDKKHIRVPAFANWVEQNILDANQWCARFWNPEFNYTFKHNKISHTYPIIYEAHIGMAQDKSNYKNIHSYGTYNYFKDILLPQIKEQGFNTIQLMGIAEHPLYKSFGYQVSSYFAVCHRFGTVNEFKELIDRAHELGICVLLDIVHSHATSNTKEGIAKYDTSSYLFCKKLSQWGTALFDYTNEMTRRFLLSNCRYWQEEFNIDGFRFDAVGTMMYNDEGFQDDFSHVSACFYTKENTDRRNKDGILYLQLANTLIHEIYPQAITIAEEFSGAPGLTSQASQAGLGFDYRFAMGVPDFWDKYITKELTSLDKMWTECSYHRLYDRTLSYVECHDQSINGEDAMIWRIIGDDMYTNMSFLSENWNVSRGIALIKLMKLITFSLADKGYMNFMGNEFCHPEWIDVDVNPYRQWDLSINPLLHYKALLHFNTSMFNLLDNALYKSMPRLRLIDEEKKLIVFERNKILFAFNFDDLTAAHFKVYVTTGKYKEIFSTDESEFAGHDNLTAKQAREYFTKEGTGIFEQDLELYLPPLTALVLKKFD